MSLVTQKSPFKWLDIFDDMNDFFLSREDRLSMPVDLMEDGDSYIIEASLPGISKDQLNIEVNKAERFIEIKVNQSDETHEEKEQNGMKYLHRERFVGTTSRRIRFGTPIDPDNAQTSLENGILSIKIPKSSEAKTVKLDL